MRILFISQYYPPEIGAASNRIGYFAQYLAKKGYDVSVLATSPNYPEGKIYSGYKNRFSVKNEYGVNIYRTRVFLSVKKNTFARIAHYLSFVFSALVARRKISKPDVIIATSPPLFVGIIGVIFKKLWKVPLITDIRDIWPASVASVGAVKNKKLLKQGEKLADWIYKNADKISVTSHGIQRNIAIKYQEKISVLPNGADLDLFRQDETSNKYQIRKKYGLQDRFVVLYTGNLGLAQAPEVLIETAKILKNESKIAFLVVGSGVELPKMEATANKFGLSNIIFTGGRPRVEMPSFIADSNLCIIPYKAADTFRNTLPSKIFDYMAGGRAIIINLQGEASELIEKAECGILAKEENAEDMARIILELYKNLDLSKQMGISGRAFVEKHYLREKISEDLASLMNKFKFI